MHLREASERGHGVFENTLWQGFAVRANDPVYPSARLRNISSMLEGTSKKCVTPVGRMHAHSSDVPETQRRAPLI